MKKILIVCVLGLGLVSCSTTRKTARTETLPYAMYNATVADLEVSPDRVSYTYKPSKDIRRAGAENCKKAAIHEALTKYGNADLLVEPEFIISKYDGLFTHKITSVTVTGRPAKYKNFRSLNDSVWCDPVFRGVKGTTFNIFKGVKTE